MSNSDNKFILFALGLAVCLFGIIGLIAGWALVAMLLAPIALLAAFLGVLLVMTKAFDHEA